jgi:hypothetical protein
LRSERQLPLTAPYKELIGTSLLRSSMRQCATTSTVILILRARA